MRPWYCAQTHYNQEFDARRHLERQGFVTFLPCYLVKYGSGNIRPKLLFRNYIFVSFDDPVLWPRINRTIGIQRVMVYEPEVDKEADIPWYHMPRTVASAAIEELRLLSLSYDEIRREGKVTVPKQIITEGCYVRVINGVLRNEESAQKALVEWTENDRAGLALEMFNRKVQVEFYLKDLALVE